MQHGDPTTTDDGLVAFQTSRGRLFGIAYRMLGSAAEAEDVVQDSWLRWQATDRAAVAEPAAFLARIVTNLSLTALDSARVRREEYVGIWLPEPVLTASSLTTSGAADAGAVPLDDVQQRDTISIALLMLLERLSPAERAAYILREAFAYSHREIAEILETTEVNARQLHSRARRRVDIEPVHRADPSRARELIERFLAAARLGDLAALEALLTEDAVSRADGGGVVSAARRPVLGRNNVARFLLGIVQKFESELTGAVAEVNGEPAIVATDDTGVAAVWFLTNDGESIHVSVSVLNPAKLRFVDAQLSQRGGLSSLS